FTTSGVLVLKKLKSEKDLASNWWNIEYKEITFPRLEARAKSSASQLTTLDNGGMQSEMRSGKTSTLRATTQMSLATSLVSAAGQLDSVIVGLCRGNKVAYKPLDIAKVNVTRKVLIEFRQVCGKGET